MARLTHVHSRVEVRPRIALTDGVVQRERVCALRTVQSGGAVQTADRTLLALVVFQKGAVLARRAVRGRTAAGQTGRVAGRTGSAVKVVRVLTKAQTGVESEVAVCVARLADSARAAREAARNEAGTALTGRARQSEALRAAADAAVQDEVAARQASRARAFRAAVGAADDERVARAAHRYVQSEPVFADARIGAEREVAGRARVARRADGGRSAGQTADEHARAGLAGVLVYDEARNAARAGRGRRARHAGREEGRTADARPIVEREVCDAAADGGG